MATIYFELPCFDEGPAPGDFVELEARGDREKSRVSDSELIWHVDGKQFVLVPQGVMITADDLPNQSESVLAGLRFKDGVMRLFGSKWDSGRVTPDPGSLDIPPTGYYLNTNEADPQRWSYYEGTPSGGSFTTTGTGGSYSFGNDLITSSETITDNQDGVLWVRTERWGVPDGYGGYQYYFDVEIKQCWADERDPLAYREEARSLLGEVDWGDNATKLDDESIDTSGGAGWGSGKYGYGFWQNGEQGGLVAYSWRSARVLVFARDWRFLEWEFDTVGNLTREGEAGAAQTPHYDKVTPMEFHPGSDLVFYEGPQYINP